MTLVLLSRFDDSDESIVGYTLCKTLAEEGSELYVTTTSTGEDLRREWEKAEEISTRSNGSITLLQPQSDESSDTDWIVKHHVKYFPHLQELTDVQTVIGLIPGTEQTALELKGTLKCNLKLFAFTQIEDKGKEQEILCKLLEKADEIWALGSNIHIYYQHLLQRFEVPDEKLKRLSLQPFTKSISWVKKYSPHIGKSKSKSKRHIVSVWRNPFSLYHFRRVTEVNGSNVESFLSLGLALEEINTDEEVSIKPRWMINQLSSKDWNILKESVKLYDSDLAALTSVSLEEEELSDQCSAFIAPEVQDDSFNFAALTAMSCGIPTFVSSQSTLGKFLLEFQSPLVNRALVHLTGDVDSDRKIWIEKLSTEILGETANSIQWAKVLRKQLKKSHLSWNIGSFTLTTAHPSIPAGKILVLLHRFSESQESCLGYQLCQKLVKEGYHLLVSTTSSGKKLENENQKAKWLTDTFSGSVTLLEPLYGEQEKPSVEWIEHPNNQHFQLSQLKNVMLTVGMLPGTSQTSAYLKEKLHCKLVLLVTSIIASNNNDLKKEICTLSEKADEIWSVGNETYTHFQSMFEELTSNSCEKHKEFLLQPLTLSSQSIKPNSETHRRSIISVCSKPVPFFYKDRTVYLKGSNSNSFSVVGEALEKIEQEFGAQDTEALQWHIYGSPVDSSLPSLQRHTLLQIKRLDEITSIDEVAWRDYTLFIAPDIVDNSFNFPALCALWLGVPTLVSSHSSIGKFLLSLSCPATTRAVVTLTGDPKHDTEAWIEKINQEILAEDAIPNQRARELSEHLQNNSDLWEIDFSGLRRNKGRRYLSSSNVSSTSSQSSGQRSNGRTRRLHPEGSFASQVSHVLVRMTSTSLYSKSYMHLCYHCNIVLTLKYLI